MLRLVYHLALHTYVGILFIRCHVESFNFLLEDTMIHNLNMSVFVQESWEDEEEESEAKEKEEKPAEPVKTKPKKKLQEKIADKEVSSPAICWFIVLLLIYYIFCYCPAFRSFNNNILKISFVRHQLVSCIQV